MLQTKLQSLEVSPEILHQIESQSSVGTIISTYDSPNPSSATFVLKAGIAIHKGQYVEIEHNSGKIIALVSDIFKTNKYFERADSVKEFEENGYKIDDLFPVTNWEHTLVKIKPLGMFKNGLVARPTTSVSPGAKVTLPDQIDLQNFLGLNDLGLNIGKIPHHDTEVKLGMSKLFQKHLAILAMSGAGKSYTVNVLLEELLNRPENLGQLSVLLFDSHGEYTNFIQDKKFRDKVQVIKGNDIRLGLTYAYASSIASFLPNMSQAQQRDLDRIMMRLRNNIKQNGPFNLKILMDEVSKDNSIKESTRGALLSWLYTLKGLNIFDCYDTHTLNEILDPGKLTIIDLSDITSIKKKQMLVTYYGKRMFYDRRAKKIPPSLLILEEAHQFIPETASSENALSRGIMVTIAREGRKFGCALCLISQRPIQLATTVLSQCNTHLILRISNPYDLDHLGRSSEGLDRSSLEMITSLKPGEAVIVGEAVNYPLFFKVRKKEVCSNMHESNLEEAAILYKALR